MAILNNTYYKEYIEEVSKEDRDIREYINKGLENYDEIIKNDDRWEIFYNLSSLREALLNWYDFKEGSEVLEIGAEFGALTGVMCNKCTKVTAIESSIFKAESIVKRYIDKNNLEVFVGQFKDIEFSKKFDYIVVTRILEDNNSSLSLQEIYSDFLVKLKGLLNDNGKIILAVQNRFGIKYFCGGTEEKKDLPFETINSLHISSTKHCFSKKELENVISKAGFSHRKFYYPLPDYKLPQMIYSEDYLPENNIGERLIPYYIDKKGIVACESDLYNHLVENNVFEFFSNSYLVEISLDNKFCDTIYAAISIDRGEENSFLTTIHKNSIVKKRALYKQGNKNTVLLHQNMKEIKSRGINVVENKLEENTIIMPYVKENTLANYLKEIIKTNKDEFIHIIDTLYEKILKSSEIVNPEENRLANSENKYLKWGPILKKAYIELIPLNSFYIDNEIVFFDQEFVKENYPAKYILFRALNYIYYFSPYINEIVPLDYMKEKYELFHVWDIFNEEERKFIYEIRNHERYKNFYKMVGIDKKTINNNIDRLYSSTRKTEEYIVTPKMKKLRKIQLELLQEFISICNKNNLKYYMIYGTLLGAVRHNGYIPWDDDIDVCMPREDYEKFSKIANEASKEKYFYQTMKNDPNCFYNGYSRLRDSSTTGIAVMDTEKSCNNGVWIDIFPLDNYTNDKRKRERKLKKIKRVQRLLYAKVYGDKYEELLDMSKIQLSIYKVISKIFRHENLCNKLDTYIKKNNDPNSEYLAIFTHYNQFKVFERKSFEESIQVQFENLKVEIPKGYKRCLEMCIGIDYMKYPPKEKQVPHHRGIFNTEYSYKKYKEVFIDIFKDIKDEKIIIFGAGLMFEEYMNRYKEKYKPEFIVDNDKSKWGNKKQNIIIKAPENILNIPEENRHVVICSVHYVEIEKQLKEMGITDYKIYIQNKDLITKNINE